MSADPIDRRELILSSAAEIFAKKGVRATTVRGIADAVGLLSGSLYHHFPSKDAIIQEILTRYLVSTHERYVAATAGDKTSVARLHDLVLASLQIAEEQPHATAIYQNDAPYLLEHPEFAPVLETAAENQQTWLRVINAGVADGSFRKDIPPRVFHRLIRDAVWLSFRWHQPEGVYTTTQLAEDITSLFLEGFCVKPA